MVFAAADASCILFAGAGLESSTGLFDGFDMMVQQCGSGVMKPGNCPAFNFSDK
jgi:hypothetical protein